MTDKPARKPKKKNPSISPVGDQYELSGDFRGAIINIKSTVVGSAEIQDIENLPPEPGDPPYLGLQYFDEKDADRFFGREQLIARVIGRLRQNRFLAIIGASGSGKSSLLRAGVIPALRRGERLADGGLPPTDSGKWAILVLTPSTHPLEALAIALLDEASSASAMAEMAEQMARNERTLGLAARQYLSRSGKKHLLLVIDQFEEVFTLCRNPAEREAFINNLLQAIDPQEALPITILITLRADFYAQLAQHDRLRETISQFQEFIGAMNRDELVRAIDQPLALGQWKIQEGLIEVILDDIGYEPGALPLLSHALLETWKRRRGRTLTLSGYNEAGGVRGAIAQTAEAVFRTTLAPEQQAVARMIFLRMAEIGQDTTDTRRRAAYSELLTRSTDELVIDTVINILVDARLITTSTLPPESTRVVEVAHEALIREWPTLRQWLDEDRQGRILHQQIIEDTGEWIKLDRDPGLLYRGAKLQQAKDWAAKNSAMLSLLEGEFLEASYKINAQESEQARRLARASRLQRVYVTVTVALVLVVAYFVYTYIYHVEPAQMDGFYNIAVADFAPALAENDLSAQLYASLREQLQENPNILIWHDSPDLEKLNVKIGAVEGSDNQQRIEAAAQLATRLNADMVIYGASLPQSPAQIALEFYLAPQQDYNYEDIQGSFEFGAPIPLEGSDASQIQQGLSQQASSLAWIAVGLSEAQLGHSLEALEAFQRADQIFPDAEMVKFLIGREYLFLVDRESVLQFARDAFEKEAEQAFHQAIRLRQDYARAYVGLGGVYFKRAQRLINPPEEGTSAGSQENTDLAAAKSITEDAIAAYNTVVDLNPDPAEYGIPLDSVARLGLGNSYRLQGQISWLQGNDQQAFGYFDQAIHALESTIVPFADAGQERYLTQAYEYLGATHQWRGYLYEVSQDFASSLESYRLSAEYFEKCIAQGDHSGDRIITEEIIAKICSPNHTSIREIIESLEGGEG
jgi:energy-coupling factor transporter ATP-binding protein EcfA2